MYPGDHAKTRADEPASTSAVTSPSVIPTLPPSCLRSARSAASPTCDRRTSSGSGSRPAPTTGDDVIDGIAAIADVLRTDAWRDHVGVTTRVT